MATATKSKPKPTDAERFPACKSCGQPIDEAPRWTTYGGSGKCARCEPSPGFFTRSPLSTVTPAGIRANDLEAAKPERRTIGGLPEKRLPRDWGIEIDPEFKAVYRSPYADELAMLCADLKANGCLAPLIVWYQEGIEQRPGHKHFGQRVAAPSRTLLDGHNRFQICADEGIPVALIELRFASRDEARAWIEAHQVARRNLSPQERDEVLARAYERELEARKSLFRVLNEGKNEGKAADKVAKETGASPATVKRAVKSQKARYAVAQASGRSLRELQSLNRREVTELAALAPPQIADALACGIEHWRLDKETRRLEEAREIKTPLTSRAATNRIANAIERLGGTGDGTPPATRKPGVKATKRDQRAAQAADELRREATRHIERYLDTLDDADAWQQSEYLLDALNAWRGRHKPPAKKSRRPK